MLVPIDFMKFFFYIFGRIKLIRIIKFLIPLFLYGCGQSIGYHEVDSEIRYYHSSDPEWLPSAAGPGPQRVFIKLENVNKSELDVFETIAKDDKNVWYKGKPIIGADPESFVKLDGPYQKDKASVYFEGERFENVNPDQFEVLKSDGYVAYARSDNHVFFRDKSLRVNSIQNFEIIQGYNTWARDGMNYYSRETQITTGKYNDIEIINNGWIKDKLFVYGGDGDTLMINKEYDSDTPSLDLSTIEKTEHFAYLKDRYGYIDVHSKLRVSVKDYEYQIKHDN